jgi:hypothetical protein
VSLCVAGGVPHWQEVAGGVPTGTEGGGGGYAMGPTPADDVSPYLLSALRRYLPSNEAAAEDSSAYAVASDAYACDEFRMYEFKVRRCARGRSHNWTDCPFAHPGEKARRRDPRRYRTQPCKDGTACRHRVSFLPNAFLIEIIGPSGPFPFKNKIKS